MSLNIAETGQDLDLRREGGLVAWVRRFCYLTPEERRQLGVWLLDNSPDEPWNYPSDGTYWKLTLDSPAEKVIARAQDGEFEWYSKERQGVCTIPAQDPRIVKGRKVG